MRTPRDRGYKARAICIDGPGRQLGLGRHVEAGECVTIRVLAEGVWRRAVYESVGPCPEVPKGDGVGLKFIGYENQEVKR